MVNRSEKKTGCGENLETHGDVKIWEPMGLLMAGKIHPDVWGSVSRLWLPEPAGWWLWLTFPRGWYVLPFWCLRHIPKRFIYLKGFAMGWKADYAKTVPWQTSPFSNSNPKDRDSTLLKQMDPDGNCCQAILKDRAEMQEKREMYCTSMGTDICYLIPFNYFRFAALLEKFSHFTVAIVCKLNWPRRMDGTGQHWISVKMILIRIIQVKV